MPIVNFCLSIASPLCLGALLSFLFERLLRPKPVPWWRRPQGALMIHLGLWMVSFSLLLILYRRPYLAAANVLALFLFAVLVSNAKFQVLHEPLVVQDLDFFLYPLKYPRLYIPFFGAGRILVVIIAIGGTLLASLRLETSLIGRFPPATFWFGVSALCTLGGLLVWLGARQNLVVTFEPETDLRDLGLLASMWCYGAEERKPFAFHGASVFSTPPVLAGADLPHLVVVESESFFDVRRWFSWIRPEVLRHFDQLKQTATCHGFLEVPAWGANTVRSEFAFLSGLGSDELGIHRFNPFRYVARQGVPTLANYLKGLGYRTVCVHPHHASFFARNRVFPLLGFDEFIDIRSFNGAEKSGAYVSDLALASKVCRLLEKHAKDSTRPVFLFIITMENHGPLRLERVEPPEAVRYYVSPPPNGCDDLTVYLRHLVHADQMIGMLREYLESLTRNSLFCFFGDHLPIMEKVYELWGTPNGHTDYVVWNKERFFDTPVYRDMRIENLGALLLREMKICMVDNLTTDRGRELSERA
jgi:hypothetical protein